MSFFHQLKDDGRPEAFEKQQRLFADKARPLLNPDLCPDRSDADLAWLKNETSIEESVALTGGDQKDVNYVLSTLSGAARYYHSLYGEQPSEGQLAAMGGALESFRNWKDLAVSGKLNRQIITEAVGESSSDNFSIIPHFMTVAALIPLTAVSYSFCHSIGVKKADKTTVYELREMAGKNAYGIPEDTEINGFYDGGLSNTRRREEAEYELDINGEIVIDTSISGVLGVKYSRSFDYPVSKSRVFLIVNKRAAGMDNGAGGFNIIGDGEYDENSILSVDSSYINYWDSVNNVAKISVDLKFDAECFPSDDEGLREAIKSIPVWFRVETDVENYPGFISETKYATRSFDLYSEAYVLSAGLTLRAILKSIRNMKRNVPDIAFSRLLSIVAADMDRKTLRDLYDYSEGEREFSLALKDYRDPYEQWARIREPMNRLSEEMKRRTGGAAGIQAFIGGSEFKLLFMNMGDKWVKLADTARNPALANQPHCIGTFEGYHLFFNPSFPASANFSEEIAIGVGRGLYVSQCGAVLGMSSPPLLHQHTSRADLSRHCSVYGESFSDQPPGAYKYVSRLKLVNIV